MRRTLSAALGAVGLLAMVAGVAIAGASAKFDSTETILFPSGSLVVDFSEGSQKRFSSVDYQLTATASATSCSTVDGQTQCISALSYQTDTVTGLAPDEKGRVAGSLTLERPEPPTTFCPCSLRMEYSDVMLTNLTSGHVYRLDPISGDSP